MKKLFVFITIILTIISYGDEIVYYKTNFLGIEITNGAFYNAPEMPVSFSQSERQERTEVEVQIPPATLSLLWNEGSREILVVPGLDLYINKDPYPYQKRFKKSLLDVLKDLKLKAKVFFYQYPSEFESLWDSAKRLTELASSLNLKDLYVIAHSKGGLVVRAALLNESFRSKVKKVVFLATPHLGTPLADALIVPPDSFKTHFGVSDREAEDLKMALALSYSAGYVNSPGSRELSWKNPTLPPLENYEGIQFTFVAGMVNVKTLEDIEKYLNVNLTPPHFGPFFGLFYLSAVSDIIISKSEEFAATDGLVPVRSALALGKLKGRKILIYGANHASFVYRKDLLKRALIDGF